VLATVFARRAVFEAGCVPEARATSCLVRVGSRIDSRVGACVDSRVGACVGARVDSGVGARIRAAIDACVALDRAVEPTVVAFDRAVEPTVAFDRAVEPTVAAAVFLAATREAAAIGGARAEQRDHDRERDPPEHGAPYQAGFGASAARDTRLWIGVRCPSLGSVVGVAFRS